MIRAFRGLVAEAKGIVRAEVTLAQAPSDAAMADIKAALQARSPRPRSPST